jgi:hypothetical protein
MYMLFDHTKKVFFGDIAGDIGPRPPTRWRAGALPVRRGAARED